MHYSVIDDDIAVATAIDTKIVETCICMHSPAGMLKRSCHALNMRVDM